jgi:hypothetical protein
MMNPQSAPLPLTEKQKTFWLAEIKKARQARKDVAERHGWQDNLDRYEPQAKKGRRRTSDINIGVDFADVESKKAALLFTTPSVALTDVAPGLQQPVAIHQELLNTILGPEHANVLPVAQRAIFNCLCPSGIGPVVVGYSCVKQDVEQTMLAVDPASGLPQVDPLTGQPMTQTVTVPVPIHEKFFVSDLSPMALLLPKELRTTDYQGKAAWIGYEWTKPQSQVRREFRLPLDFSYGGESEKPYFERGEEADDSGDPPMSGVTLWYRAHLMPEPGTDDSDLAKHPEQMRKLTIIGDQHVVEHLDSPDQEIGPEGRLTPDSLVGFNVRPLVLRDLSDSAWIPSDCAVTAGLTKEQQRYREIALRKRDTSASVIAYEPTKLPVDAVAKAKKEAGHGGIVWVPVPDGALAQGGATAAAELVRPTQGRETYLDQDLIRQDRDRVLATGNNQVGVRDKSSKTATETSIVQRNTDARFEQERQRVERWYLYDLVKSVDALILRYCDERLAAQILGAEKAKIWIAAKPALAGGYRYSLQMDSGKYLDVEDKRRQTLQLFNLLAKSPFVNQAFLHQKIAEDFGYDPTQFLTQPEPPKPEPPKMALSFNGQDLIGPQAPIVLEILNALGVPISPQAIQTSQALLQMNAQIAATQAPQDAGPGQAAKNPPVPGPADKAPRLDQHQLSETGRMSGPGPM